MNDYNNRNRGRPQDRRPPQQGGYSKPPQAPVISAAEVAQLRSEVTRLKKLVEEHLAEKNQWSTEVRSWIGSQVLIELDGGLESKGILLWVDRYTMAMEETDGHKRIIHKKAIIRLAQLDD